MRVDHRAGAAKCRLARAHRADIAARRIGEQVAVGDVGLVDIGVVQLRPQSVERPRQEGEEGLVGDLRTGDAAALARVLRPQDLHRLGRPVVAEGAGELAEADVVIQLLVEAGQREGRARAHVAFERQVELIRLDRLQRGVACTGRKDEIVPDDIGRRMRRGRRVVDDVGRVRPGV